MEHHQTLALHVIMSLLHLVPTTPTQEEDEVSLIAKITMARTVLSPSLANAHLLPRVLHIYFAPRLTSFTLGRK